MTVSVDSKKEDSRWVHGVDHNVYDAAMTEEQKSFSDHLKKMIELRMEQEDFSSNQVYFYDVLTQKKYRNHDTQILGPYEVRWLKEEVKN